MHPFRAALAVVALIVLTLLTAGPAAAGGPTSALLAVPGEGKTASLYYTDPEYDALAQMVGATNPMAPAQSTPPVEATNSDRE